jgi:hypothetical protein
MSAPSRQEIRTRLRQAVRQVDRAAARVIGKFVPVGDGESGPPPAHQAHIKGDYSMCCAYHEEQQLPVCALVGRLMLAGALGGGRPSHGGDGVVAGDDTSNEPPAPSLERSHHHDH